MRRDALVAPLPRRRLARAAAAAALAAALGTAEHAVAAGSTGPALWHCHADDTYLVTWTPEADAACGGLHYHGRDAPLPRPPLSAADPMSPATGATPPLGQQTEGGKEAPTGALLGLVGAAVASAGAAHLRFARRRGQRNAARAPTGAAAPQ